MDHDYDQVARTGSATLIAALALLATLVVTANASAPTTAGTPRQLSENAAHAVLDGLYKGDFRSAFVDKRPELFLRHIPDDFVSTMVDGSQLDAAAIREAFPQQFTTMVRTIEHNVTIEDVDVTGNRSISGVVTLTTLIEHQRLGETARTSSSPWAPSGMTSYCATASGCCTGRPNSAVRRSPRHGLSRRSIAAAA